MVIVNGGKVAVSDVVCAVFADRDLADKAWNAAIARGYTPADISVVMSDEARRKHYLVARPPAGDKSLKGVGAGGLIGSAVGAVAAVLATTATSLIIPGLGIVIAGPLVALLAGAGAGGAVGGLVGALIGMGIPEKRVTLIEDHVRRGRIVLTIKARNLADAELIARDWSAYAIEVLR